MTVELWINALSALGTVGATAVAAYSARLAWKQVAYQFEPRLIVVPTSYQVAIHKGALNEFWWREPSDAAKYVNGGETDYRFVLRNIGAGPAFDIRIYAEYDFESTYSDVTQKLAGRIGHLIVESNDFGGMANIDGVGIGGFRLPDQAFGIIDTIGPAMSNQAKHPFIIDPSMAFFALCYGAYLMVAHETEEEARRTQLIPVTLRVEYTTTRGTRVVDRLKMRLAVRGGQFANDHSDGVILISIGPA